MTEFNNFGVDYNDIIHMFPGTQESDYDRRCDGDGSERINEVINSVRSTILNLLNNKYISMFKNPEFEMLAEYATAGDYSFTLGFYPVVEGSVSIFKIPESTASESEKCNCNQKINNYGMEYFKLDEDEYELEYSDSGICTVELNDILDTGDQIFSSYKVDHTDSNYKIESLSAILKYGVAAELGYRIFGKDTDAWTLVEYYKDEYKNLLNYLMMDDFVPAEINQLKWLKPIKNTEKTVVKFGNIYRA